jgi:dienelactone hydrolase
MRGERRGMTARWIAAFCVVPLLVACGGSTTPTPTTAPTTAPSGASTATVATTPTMGSVVASGSGTASVGSASGVAGTRTSPSASSSAAPTVRGSAVAASPGAAGTALAENPGITREDFTVNFGDFQSHAQFTYPASGAGPFPTVLLIPGSGPYDLDFTILDRATGQVKSHIFRDIADALTLDGYAVVRYNKHYVTGPNDQNSAAVYQQFNTLTLQQLVLDATTVYQAALKSPKVDTKRVALYGWSEGTTVATQLAVTHLEIAGLILQGLVAGTMAETFAYQDLTLGVGFLRDVVDTDKDGMVTLDEIGAAFRAHHGTVLGFVALMTLDLTATTTGGTPKLNAQVDTNGDGRLDIAGEIVPYWQNVFATFDKDTGPYAAAYAPSKALPVIVDSLPKYKGPVLILQGAHDANVDPDSAKRVDNALAAAGAIDHTLLTYPGLGHSLGVAASTDTDDFQPIAAQPLTDTKAWLDKRFKKG